MILDRDTLRTSNRENHSYLAITLVRVPIMKIIITGATGRIGGAALQDALSNSLITTVVVLSRRETGIKHAKLQTVIKKDFLQYSTEELEQLEGAEACIWYLLYLRGP